MVARPIARAASAAALLLALALALPAAAQATCPPLNETLVLEAFSKLETFVQGAMKAEKVPGLAYAVVFDGKVIGTKTMGVKKLGASDPVDVDTMFEIGSTTKAFTAAILGQLVDEGRLSYEDRVRSYLHAFAMKDPWVGHEMRVIDLSAHRSGMPAYALDGMAFFGFERADLIHSMAHVDPVSSFRDGYAYQNVTFLIAARLIEERTGLPWEDNLALRLFGPLGMTSSTTDRALFESMPDVATGHIPSGGGYYAIPKGWPWSQWLDVLGPAGNIRSNVPDMARWAIFNLGDGTYEGQTLLTPSTFRLLKAPRTLAGSQPDSSVSYAQGWVHVSRAPHPVVWHNGGTAGMHSIVFLVPDARVGLVMLTNSSDNKVPENSGWKLYDLLFGTNLAPTAAVRGMVELGEQARQTADIPAFASVPPLPLDRYVGTYQNPAYGRAVVTATGDKLQFTLGPKHVTMDLAHYSGNTFRLVATGTPAQAGLVTFVVKGSQKAERFVSTLLSESNGGNFVAVR